MTLLSDDVQYEYGLRSNTVNFDMAIKFQEKISLNFYKVITLGVSQNSMT